MIVVFDSSVWLSELGLQSGVGSAVRFYLTRHGAQLALPEVVRLEVSHNLRSRLQEHITRIGADHRQLLAVFGKLKQLVLPTADEVEDKVTGLFTSLGIDVLDVPFTLESARSSFLKTIEKIPPSAHSQQFKDGVLWADCLQLLDRDAVTLVTADKAFYQDQRYERGLAVVLAEEAAAASHPIRILPGLRELLDSIRSPVELDLEGVIAAFMNRQGDNIRRILTPLGFEISERVAASYKVFATEDPHSLFVTFDMTYKGEDVDGRGSTGITIWLNGDALYAPASGEYTDIRNQGQRWAYTMPDGTLRENRAVMLSGGIVIGHREVAHSIRYALG
jgi:hypothetical protein